MICDISMRNYAICAMIWEYVKGIWTMWFVIVFGYGVCVFYDAYMFKIIILFVYG